MGKATKASVALDSDLRGKPYSSRPSSPNPVAAANPKYSQRHDKDGLQTTASFDEPASRTAAKFSYESTSKDYIPPPSIVISNNGYDSCVDNLEGIVRNIDGPMVLPSSLETVNGSTLDAIPPTILQLPPRDNSISVLLSAFKVPLAMLLT
jgi:hypothetical protein